MKEEQDDLARPSDQPITAYDVNRRDKESQDNEDFGIFDDESEDSYEEPERDTDFSLGFREEIVDEDYAFDSMVPSEFEEDQSALFEEQEAFLKEEARDITDSEDADLEDLWVTSPLSGETGSDEPFNAYSDSNATESEEHWDMSPPSDSVDNDSPGNTGPGSIEKFIQRNKRTSPTYPQENVEEPWVSEEGTEEAEEHWEQTADARRQETFEDSEPDTPWSIPPRTSDDQGQPWMGNSEYTEEAAESGRWPISMVAVGTLALLLVIAGVYGVMQQRSATEEEIRQLRASLATAVSPEEVAASRSALQESNALNRDLIARVDSLKLENQRLTDTISGLETQLAAQAAKAAPVAAAKSAPKPAPAPEPKAAAPTPRAAAPTPAAATITAGAWFVNFGSYGQQAMAEEWAARLQPGEGKVIVAPSTSNGRTYYRVRVINIADNAGAQRVARGLESDHGVSELWIGKQ